MYVFSVTASSHEKLIVLIPLVHLQCRVLDQIFGKVFLYTRSKNSPSFPFYKENFGSLRLYSMSTFVVQEFYPKHGNEGMNWV